MRHGEYEQSPITKFQIQIVISHLRLAGDQFEEGVELRRCLARGQEWQEENIRRSTEAGLENSLEFRAQALNRRGVAQEPNLGRFQISFGVSMKRRDVGIMRHPDNI